MPVCTNCKRLKNIYNCSTEITVGVVDPEIGVLIYFENVATGKITTISGESDIDGNIIFSMPFAPSTTIDYKVWLSVSDPLTADEPLTVLIGGIEVECFMLRFDRIYNETNTSVSQLSQTFELA